MSVLEYVIIQCNLNVEMEALRPYQHWRIARLTCLSFATQEESARKSAMSLVTTRCWSVWIQWLQYGTTL